MNYLTKLIFISLFFLFNTAYSNTSNTKNEIIFKLDNEIFTTIDLDNRKKYLELINKTKLIKKENYILNDLINVTIYDKFFNTLIFLSILKFLEIFFN